MIVSSIQSRVFVRRGATVISGVIVLAVILLAIFGPFLAPHSPYQPVGLGLLGTDGERAVWNGLPWPRCSLPRTVRRAERAGTRGDRDGAPYIAGLTMGMIAGFSKSLIDPLLMRSVDVPAVLPRPDPYVADYHRPGTGVVPLVIGAAIVQVPSVARIIRTATLEQSVRGFVEAAEARGERMPVILWREILPNISGPIAADAGLRITYSILIIASVNFLGLGLQPPAADWGLMVAENRQGISLNPLAVLVPAALIAILTISLNIFADGILRMRQER